MVIMQGQVKGKSAHHQSNNIEHARTKIYMTTCTVINNWQELPDPAITNRNMNIVWPYITNFTDISYLLRFTYCLY